MAIGWSGNNDYMQSLFTYIKGSTMELTDDGYPVMHPVQYVFGGIDRRDALFNLVGLDLVRKNWHLPRLGAKRMTNPDYPGESILDETRDSRDFYGEPIGSNAERDLNVAILMADAFVDLTKLKPNQRVTIDGSIIEIPPNESES